MEEMAVSKLNQRSGKPALVTCHLSPNGYDGFNRHIKP